MSTLHDRWRRWAYLGFTESSHAKETPVVIDGHDTRNNGTSNSNLAAIIYKLEENVSVIEQLGNDEICSSINLPTKKKKRKNENPNPTDRKTDRASIPAMRSEMAELQHTFLFK